MSGSNQNLKVTFSADTQQLMAAIDRVNQSINATTAGMQRAQASASAAQAGLAQAWDQAGTAMNYAAKAAAALGIALAGMKITEIAANATQSAARFETMGVVLNRLAQNTQYSATQIGQFAVGVEGMGITMTGSREVISRMIQAQIDLSKATGLARVAQDAAVIGNTNSSEALERLIYGIQSAQVEMLRTLGLNVSFEQSYQRLAAALNKPVDALTEVEKTQARVGAALQAGITIAGAYEASMGTAGKQLASMSRLVEDFQTKLGEAFLPAFTAGVQGATQALGAMNKALDSPEGRAAIEGVGDALKGVVENSGALAQAVGVGIGVTMTAHLVRATVAAGGLSTVLGGAASAVLGHWGLLLTAATTALTYFLTAQNRAVAGAQQTSELLARETTLRSGATNALERQTQAQKDLNAAREAAATRGLERDLTDQQRRNQDAMSGLRGFVGSAAFERQVPRAGAFQESDVLGAASANRGLAFAQYVRAFQDFANSAAPANEAVKQLSDRLQALDAAQKNAGQATMFGRSELRAWVQTLAEGVPAADLLAQRIEGLKNAMKAPGSTMFDLSGAQQQIRQTLEGLGLAQRNGQILEASLAKSQGLEDALNQQLQSLRDAYADTWNQMAKMPEGTDAWNARLQLTKDIASQIDILLRGWPTIMGAVTEATGKVGDKSEGRSRFGAVGGGGSGDAVREAGIRADWARKIAEAEAAGAYAVRMATAEMEKLIAASKGGTALAEAAARAREAEAKAIGESVAQSRMLMSASQNSIGLSLAQLQGPAQAAAAAREQERQRLMGVLGPSQPDALNLGLQAFDWKQIDQAVTSMTQMGLEAQRATAAAQAELGVIGQSNAEREKAVALAQLRLQYETALAGASEEQRQKLQQAYEASSAYITRLAAVKEQVEAAARIQQAMQQMGDAIGQAFQEAVLQGKNLNQVLNSLMQTLMQIFAKQIIFAPLQNMLSSGLGSLFGGGGGLGGIFGNLFGGGGLSTTSSNFGGGVFAQGGIPGAPSLAAFRNGFVDRPTVFPFAKGGTVGLMGEAGTEAIFPVFRTSNGDLGVKVGNDNRPGGGKVEVNVYNQGGGEATTQRETRGDREIINVMIDQAVGRNMSQPGTRSYRSVRDTFGGRQTLVAR
jgi:hypothetical protein